MKIQNDDFAQDRVDSVSKVCTSELPEPSAKAPGFLKNKSVPPILKEGKKMSYFNSWLE